MGSLILGAILLVVLYLIMAPDTKGKKSARSAASKAPIGQVARNQYVQAAPVMEDYNDYLLSTGLERGVIDSHRQFVDDIQQTTTGASAMTELSGDNYDVPFVGLRRPQLDRIYVDPNARTVTSSETWQYPNSTKYDRCGLY